MKRMESNQQKLARVANELGTAIQRQAGGTWSKVRTARRNLGTRHVWRFRTDGGDPDRFLLLSNDAMVQGKNPAAALLAQLSEERWLDRLQNGPETCFKLGSTGRLHARPAN